MHASCVFEFQVSLIYLFFSLRINDNAPIATKVRTFTHPALAQSLNHIEKTTSNLEVSTRQLNQMLSKDVPGIVNNLKTMTDNFSEVSANLKELDLATTVNSINATLANLKLTTDKLNSTDNSIGLLLNDKGLYDNLNSTMDNASKLLLDLRENPKRYVHFSVF